MNNYFRKAEDLETKENMSNYFKIAGDLSDISNDIKKYLKMVVTNQKMEGAVGGGMMIVSFTRLQELVDSGCNIISAEYINPDMIAIEFQEFEIERKSGR